MVRIVEERAAAGREELGRALGGFHVGRRFAARAFAARERERDDEDAAR